MNIQQNLDNLHDYFAGRADASCEPGDDRYRGNAEMGLLQDVEAVEAEVKRLAALLSEGQRPSRQALIDSLASASAQAEKNHAYAERLAKTLQFIVDMSDLAMADGDGARAVAKAALGVTPQMFSTPEGVTFEKRDGPPDGALCASESPPANSTQTFTVPEAVFRALQSWTGAEPSQSILARALEEWGGPGDDQQDTPASNALPSISNIVRTATVKPVSNEGGFAERYPTVVIDASGMCWGPFPSNAAAGVWAEKMKIQDCGFEDLIPPPVAPAVNSSEKT